MKDNHVILKVEAIRGSTILDVAREAVRLSEKLGIGVESDPGGITVLAFPGESVDTVLADAKICKTTQEAAGSIHAWAVPDPACRPPSAKLSLADVPLGLLYDFLKSWRDLRDIQPRRLELAVPLKVQFEQHASVLAEFLDRIEKERRP